MLQPLAALILALGLAAAAGAHFVSEPSPVGGLPPPASDIPRGLAEQELCAAVITADGRVSQAFDSEAADDFGARNDAFRASWIARGLAASDPTRDWTARVAALADKVPGVRSRKGSAALNAGYVACIETQNSDPAFVAAYHAFLGYEDPV